jgi:hypothetical protein
LISRAAATPTLRAHQSALTLIGITRSNPNIMLAETMEQSIFDRSQETPEGSMGIFKYGARAAGCDICGIMRSLDRWCSASTTKDDG